MAETNIRALAKELNLSISTVSKALRDSYEISAETKQRVVKLAAELNYHPNIYASSLRRKKSNTIAVVIPEVADSFFSVAIKGIEEVAQTKGYHVLIYLTFESFIKEKKILEEFKNGRVDGVLMSVSSETTEFTHIETLNNSVPFVFFDRAVEEMEAARITTNDFEISYEATKHLIECGCKKIKYLSISNSLAINTKRMAGFKAAMNQFGIELNEMNISNCSNCIEENSSLLETLLSGENKPDAIIASVEKLIAPVYSICQTLAIQIPADLKVLCFSNLPIAHILNPSLTTVTQPAFDIGKMAATILFKSLEKRSFILKKERLVVPSSLIIRGSTVCR
ncbi:MAG TPA: LacI family DNA-binding transcriptional regulator [Segetibacter sp.]